VDAARLLFFRTVSADDADISGFLIARDIGELDKFKGLGPSGDTCIWAEAGAHPADFLVVGSAPEGAIRAFEKLLVLSDLADVGVKGCTVAA